MAFIPDNQSSFVPDAPDPAQELFSLLPKTKPGRIFRAIADPVESLGQFADKGIGMASQALQQGLGNPKNPNPMPAAAQALGYATGKVAPHLNAIPKNDFGVALSPLMSQDLEQLSDSAEAVGEKVLNKAGWVSKTIANALNAANRVKPNQIAAVISNPEIMSSAVPTPAAVSKMYEDAFEEAGMKIDDARYKYLTGLNRPLRDQQIGKAEKIADMAFDPMNPARLREGLTETEAFIARTASSKLERSAAAATNPEYLRAVQKQTAMLDDFLENSTMPQIKKLNRLWFMAKTKEAMLEPLPLNKQGTPNALSTLLMAAQFKKAAENFAEGSPLKATWNAGLGALASPAVLGAGMKAANFVGQNPGASSQILNNVLSSNDSGQQ